MSIPTLSLDENIETLRRSCLPTIVTEGRDDYVYYRRFEEMLSDIGASLYPVSGRDMVLQIFENRRRLQRNDVIFIVDQDIFVFTGPPQNFVHRKILYTNGYSVENDMYTDGTFEDLLYESEKCEFQKDLTALLYWYSFAIDKILRGDSETISYHPNKILRASGELCPDFAASINYSPPPEKIYQEMRGNYARLLRGKTLLELLLRQLSSSRRQTKFSRKQLFEIASSRKGSNYMQLLSNSRLVLQSLASS